MTIQSDEAAIREMLDNWMRATADGDGATLRTLMAEDVVFLLPGQPAMRGRESFMLNFETAIKQVRIEAQSSVQEIQVSGNLAYCWNQLEIRITPRSGGPAGHRSGYVLTVLRKEADGRWVVFRDANLLSAQPS
jgi:uncharacterized protein (TIGR02246 family)